MLFNFLVMALSAAGIILTAKFALYDPAQRMVSYTAASRKVSGQLLGYLTSAPEMVSTAFIAATGFFAAAAYNILGSNVINLVLAIVAAAFFKQLPALFNKIYLPELVLTVVSILIPVALLLTGNSTELWTVPVFLLLLGAYFVFNSRRGSTSEEGPDRAEGSPLKWALAVVTLLIGLVALYFLGDILGDSVFTLGTSFAVPALILGGLVAVATSLPELTTFFSSFAKHGHAGTEEVVNNMVASNVSNLLIIQTVGVLVYNIVV